MEVSATTIRKPEPASSTLMPWERTVAGSRASTRRMAFWTSTEAWSMFVPAAKVALMLTQPELSEVDSKYSRPSTPFSSSSIWRVTPW